MTDKRLYTVSIPEQAQTRGEETMQRNVPSIAAVAGGSTSVTPTGVEADERDLRVQYKGYNDDLMAAMLAELAGSDTIETVPFFGINPDGTRDRTQRDGYYSVSRNQKSNPDDRLAKFPTVVLNIKRVGTQKTDWRYLSSKPTQVENQFGNDTTEQVGVQASATKVRWYDGDISTTMASPNSTVTTEFGDVDIYVSADSPYSVTKLIYELPYPEEGKTDVSVWDTRGKSSKTSNVNGETVLDWMRVFSTSHEYQGEIVLSNSRVRMYVDENTPSLSYEEYTSGSWSSVSLGTSDWTILDVDVTTIDYSRISGWSEFQNTSNGNTYTLAFTLDRGATGFIWYIPENLVSSQGDVPSGLKTLLDPSASNRIVRMNTNQTVRKREEVRG
jgi:hypothetical protein